MTVDEWVVEDLKITVEALERFRAGFYPFVQKTIEGKFGEQRHKDLREWCKDEHERLTKGREYESMDIAAILNLMRAPKKDEEKPNFLALLFEALGESTTEKMWVRSFGYLSSARTGVAHHPWHAKGNPQLTPDKVQKCLTQAARWLEIISSRYPEYREAEGQLGNLKALKEHYVALRKVRAERNSAAEAQGATHEASPGAEMTSEITDTYQVEVRPTPKEGTPVDNNGGRQGDVGNRSAKSRRRSSYQRRVVQNSIQTPPDMYEHSPETRQTRSKKVASRELVQAA